jgi:hypothetical protein
MRLLSKRIVQYERVKAALFCYFDPLFRIDYDVIVGGNYAVVESYMQKIYPNHRPIGPRRADVDGKTIRISDNEGKLQKLIVWIADWHNAAEEIMTLYHESQHVAFCVLLDRRIDLTCETEEVYTCYTDYVCRQVLQDVQELYAALKKRKRKRQRAKTAARAATARARRVQRVRSNRAPRSRVAPR